MKFALYLLLSAGWVLSVFAEPVLKVGSFPSKGATLEQPSLAEGNKRIGLRELYGSTFAGQDFKIGVYAGKEEICRIYFLGSFRGSWGFPFKTIPGKERVAIDRTKSTISYCKEYQLPDKRVAEFRFTLVPEGPGRVRVNWDPGIPEKWRRRRRFISTIWRVSSGREGWSFLHISAKFPVFCFMRTIRQSGWRSHCRSAGDR